MKKIFVLLAFIPLIPLTAMAAESSHLKDREWVIAKANQENLWEMDLTTVNQETLLVKFPSTGFYIALNSNTKDFVECYLFSENGKLEGIIFFTDNEKVYQEIVKELILSLGTPLNNQLNQMIWQKGSNGISSFFQEKHQIYAIGITKIANTQKQSK